MKLDAQAIITDWKTNVLPAAKAVLTATVDSLLTSIQGQASAQAAAGDTTAVIVGVIIPVVKPVADELLAKI